MSRTIVVTTYNDQGVKVDEQTLTVATRPDDDAATTITDAAVTALAGNRTYVATASPTAAQTTAQVKALSRQMNGMIRLILSRLDGTD